MTVSRAPTVLSALFALSFSSATAQVNPSPRPAYWQQGVRYEINAKLDESRFELAGTEMIEYVNNSPDTLSTFSLHLYLNAFRPGSRWSDADSVERKRRFNDLKDPDYAYNHVRNVRIMGETVEPIYPFAPDSTIVRFELPRPLPPGGSTQVGMEWDARPSTLPRRQGRRGRAYDFAQWYPKVVVYDKHGWEEHPLYPGGEFYGEFATFLVDLDLPEDEVMGATGVPLCGDPGWERANRLANQPIEYQRDFYPKAPSCSSIPTVAKPAAGRKRLVWYAEDVHHFAMSMNPDYRYEGGHWGDVAIHVLYQPGDTSAWGGGVAVQRTAKALEWLDGVFGKFAWPQISNVHRIEGGGTEFPMMIHDGSADQGLIVHELGHNYLMGILANNEWREGWLDEGFTSYQTTLFDEANGQYGGAAGDEAFITGLDLDGQSEPASLQSEYYKDFTSYNISIYTRGEQFFHQLQYLVGDEAMHRILRTYYDRWKLKHVDEEAFRDIAEEVSGMDLSGFFAQGLHSTDLVDYSVGRATKRRLSGSADGRLGTTTPPNDSTSSGWSTRVEVVRKAPGRVPVEVWVIGQSDTAAARSIGLAEREWVTVETRSEPKEIRLDPRVATHDWDMMNNQKKFGFHPLGGRDYDLYLDTYFSTPVHRDEGTIGFLPTVWYNDAGGITLGLRSRSDYFGRFEQNQFLVSGGTGWATDEDVLDLDEFVRLRNPVWLRSPGMTQTLDVFNVEGRYGAVLGIERTNRPHLSFGPERKVGLRLQWVVPDDARFLVPGEYEDVGTAELELSAGVSDRRGPWRLGLKGTAGGGLVYNSRGLANATGRNDLDPYFYRATLEGTADRSIAPRWRLGLRGYAGVSAGGDGETAKQRQIYASGADPLERITNPFLRSRGALLLRPDVYYHMAGGGNLRGYGPTVSMSALVAANLELERTVLDRNQKKLFKRVSLAAFGDAGHAIADEDDPITGRNIEFLADAGAGIRAEHRLGQTTFVTRVDFPLYTSRPDLAQDQHPGGDEFGFRWLFSFEAAW